MKQENLRLATKHKRQLEDLHAKNTAAFRELELVHVS